jgi:hypothetical protein
MDKDAEAKYRKDVDALLDAPLIKDERKVLQIIADAINDKFEDHPQIVAQAVRQTVHGFDIKMRIFVYAQAKRYASRVLRMIDTLDLIEEELTKPERFGTLDNKELLRYYRDTQMNLNEHLGFVDRAANLRIEPQQAQDAMSSDLVEDTEVDSDIAMLDAQQRDRVRKLIEGIREVIREGDDGIEE